MTTKKTKEGNVCYLIRIKENSEDVLCKSENISVIVGWAKQLKSKNPKHTYIIENLNGFYKEIKGE